MIILSVLSLIVLCIVVLKLRLQKKPTVEQLIEAALQPYIRDQIKNIRIPDPAVADDKIEIEHMILTDKGIVLIETHAISGHLYGANNIEQWTQIHQHRSYKFTNPLYRIEHARYGLLALLPDMPIFCRVIFTAEDSNFPKGRPDNISLVHTLKQDLTALANYSIIPLKIRNQWNQLINQINSDTLN